MGRVNTGKSQRGGLENQVKGATVTGEDEVSRSREEPKSQLLQHRKTSSKQIHLVQEAVKKL